MDHTKWSALHFAAQAVLQYSLSVSPPFQIGDNPKMNPSELKAVLAKTNEVAVYPANIEAQLPYTVTQKNRRGLLICPTGLKRAIVIQDGAKWIEKRPVS